MVDIETGKEFYLENVLSLRKKMTQQEIQQALIDIGKFLEGNNIKKNGPIVTATFSIEQVNGQAVVDIEILVPMDKKIELSGEYTFKDVFHIVNAVYARHKGNPNMLQNTYNEIVDFINQRGLQQITVAYNVNVVDLKPGQSMDDMIVDIYIGINPSKL